MLKRFFKVRADRALGAYRDYQSVPMSIYDVRVATRLRERAERAMSRWALA